MSIVFDSKMFKKFFGSMELRLKSESETEYFINTITEYCYELSDEDFNKLIEEECIYEVLKPFFKNSGCITMFMYTLYKLKCFSSFISKVDQNFDIKTERNEKIRNEIQRAITMSIPDMNIKSVKNLYRDYLEVKDKAENELVFKSYSSERYKRFMSLIDFEMIKNETKVKRAMMEIKLEVK